MAVDDKYVLEVASLGAVYRFRFLLNGVALYEQMVLQDGGFYSSSPMPGFRGAAKVEEKKFQARLVNGKHRCQWDGELPDQTPLRLECTAQAEREE